MKKSASSQLLRVSHAASTWCVISLCTLAACLEGAELAPSGRPDGRDLAAYAATPRPALCARPREDAVRDIFCADTPARIGSLRDLQDQLDLNRRPPADQPSRAPVATDGLVDTAVFLTHSTALSGRLVSPINPRAIVFGSATILTFQRGIQQVEIVTQGRDRGGFNFYLVSFTQACNAQVGGCTAGDLYTPRIESDWTSLTLRDDEDLKNTPLDCRQCHQRGRDFPVLLMRELQSPWTHFFEPEYLPELGEGISLPGVRGRDLLLDYLRAKGDEPYAGVSSFDLRHTVGVFLQNVVEPNQPLLFDAPRIEEERWPFGPDGYPNEPSASPTWEAAYEAFKRGEQQALPYFEPRATDPDKQARLTDAYLRVRRGELPAAQLPDLSDIFPDNPVVRARIGLQTEPGAPPASTLIQACGSCHNDVLDQTISRARFSVDLTRLDSQARELAIARMLLPADRPGVMPPPEARQLDPAARVSLIEYLRQSAISAEDRAALKHAAEVGMTGGGRE